MHNAHERSIDAPPSVVGALLDQLAGPHDPLWPAPAWPAMRFDRPLGLGAQGGHGPVRYTVTDYEPGRRVRFTFDDRNGRGGHHELTVEADAKGPATRSRVRHVLETHPRGSMRLAWPLVVRWMHDAVVEDLLDNFERAATGTVRTPARWSPWVRVLNRAQWPRPTQITQPQAARLAQNAFEWVDFTDTWQLPLHPAMPQDPEVWAAATFHQAPSWVTALMHIREGLVGLVGIQRKPTRGAFAITADESNEVLLGHDAAHLDFRVSVLVEPGRVSVTTVAKFNNRRGRHYFAVVGRIHPAVVRATLRRAHRRLALSTPPASDRPRPTGSGPAPADCH